jgi:adenine C2-methylase RlmN of 23S rRNA A2503 and tRNA A37
VTVSTVGFSAAAIRALADEAPQVHLALSLHGATQPLRLKLMPAAQSCPLPALEAALDYHATATVQTDIPI